MLVCLKPRDEKSCASNIEIQKENARLKEENNDLKNSLEALKFEIQSLREKIQHLKEEELELSEFVQATESSINSLFTKFDGLEKKLEFLGSDIKKKLGDNETKIKTQQDEIVLLKRNVEDIYWQAIRAATANKSVSEESEFQVSGEEKSIKNSVKEPEVSAPDVSTEPHPEQTQFEGTVDPLANYFNELRFQGGKNGGNKTIPSAAEQHRIHKTSLEQLSKVLDRVGKIRTERLKADKSLIPNQRIRFSAEVDDDEMLLEFFHKIDSDKSGSISMNELLNSDVLMKKDNAELAKILRRVLGYDLEGFEEALKDIDWKSDFGTCKRESNKKTISALFEAAGVASNATSTQQTDTLLATRAIFVQLIETCSRLNLLKLKEALERLAGGLPTIAEDSLDFLTFRETLRKVPRVLGPRLVWANSLGFDAALARHIPPGTLEDGLDGLKRISKATVGQMLDAFCEDARGIFMEGLAQLKNATGSTSALQANSKFEGFAGTFGTLDDFHEGAEQKMKLGYPNPDIMKGILVEHTAHPSVKRIFVTPNYRIATCLLVEYWWAVDPTLTSSLYPGCSVESQARARDMLEMHRTLNNESDFGAERSDDSDLLFPGEVGDFFCESLVVVYGPEKDSSALLDSVNGKIEDSKILENLEKLLEKKEQRARGIKILDSGSCVELEAKLVNAKIEDRSCNTTGSSCGQQHSKNDRTLFGIFLPWSKSLAEKSLVQIRDCVASTISQPPSALTVHFVMCKIYEYCHYHDVSALKKHLDEFSLSELKQHALKKWNIPSTLLDKHSLEELYPVVIDAFLRQDLRKGFEVALRGAKEVVLDCILKMWGIQSTGYSKSEKIAAATSGLVTVERWEEVADWVGLYYEKIQGRTRAGLKKLLEEKHTMIENCKLLPGEVLASYLYTGPGFAAYNSIYRKHPEKMVELLKGDAASSDNTMSTTLFCISSALLKLSRHTKLPEDGKLYRGLGNMLLPYQFWVAHDTPPWKGGVELAFMSTTSDQETALFYCGGKGTVVEIDVGRIQNGGDLSWISMVRISLLDLYYQHGHLVSFSKIDCDQAEQHLICSFLLDKAYCCTSIF